MSTSRFTTPQIKSWYKEAAKIVNQESISDTQEATHASNLVREISMLCSQIITLDKLSQSNFLYEASRILNPIIQLLCEYDPTKYYPLHNIFYKNGQPSPTNIITPNVTADNIHVRSVTSSSRIFYKSKILNEIDDSPFLQSNTIVIGFDAETNEDWMDTPWETDWDEAAMEKWIISLIERGSKNKTAKKLKNHLWRWMATYYHANKQYQKKVEHPLTKKGKSDQHPQHSIVLHSQKWLPAGVTENDLFEWNGVNIFNLSEIEKNNPQIFIKILNSIAERHPSTGRNKIDKINQNNGLNMSFA